MEVKRRGREEDEEDEDEGEREEEREREYEREREEKEQLRSPCLSAVCSSLENARLNAVRKEMSLHRHCVRSCGEESGGDSAVRGARKLLRRSPQCKRACAGKENENGAARRRASTL